MAFMLNSPESLIPEARGGKREVIAVRTPGFYSVNGRFTLYCRIEIILRQEIALNAILQPRLNDVIEADFHYIGRVNGYVGGITTTGFLMAVEEERLERLRDELLSYVKSIGKTHDYRDLRIKPCNPQTTIDIGDENFHPASIINFSMSGACIETDIPLNLGQKVLFACRTQAKVVRDFSSHRYGVEYDIPFRPHEFTDYMRL